eukprot:363624-Chlamydomonas_euryale.AAC.1
MESQGAPRAAAALGDARDSLDDGEPSLLSGSHSSPQNTASFLSDVHDKSYGYYRVEGTGDDCSVSRETVSSGPSESIA